MLRIPPFLKDRENQQALSWIGGGLVVVIGGLWAAYLHFAVPTPSKSNSLQPSVTASGCSVAAGRDITGSTITAGNCAPEQKPVKP